MAERIRTGDRRIRLASSGKAPRFEATRRRQGVLAAWDVNGMILRPRSSGDDAQPVSLQTVSLSRGSETVRLETPHLALGKCGDDKAVDERGKCLPRLESRSGGVTEWWESREDGIEHGFTIDEAPLPSQRAGHALSLELAVQGAMVEVDAQGQAATFDTGDGRTLRYAALVAWDATKKSLPARLVARPNGVAIEVDDAAATYPITIDPLLTPSGWTKETDQARSPDPNNGSAGNLAIIAGAGDVNGDGFSDVAVAFAQYDAGSRIDMGRVFVYHGSTAGPGLTADWSFGGEQLPAVGSQEKVDFGSSLAAAGDVNGDGFGDLLVGADTFDDPNGTQPNEGRAYLFLGGASGLLGAPASTIQGDQASAYLGPAASAGDVNGDGFADVVISAPGYQSASAAGRAHVYYGGPFGLNDAAGNLRAPAWSYTASQQHLAGMFPLFGWAVASAGDVNGDGRSDIIVGAPGWDDGQTDEGAAFLFLSSPSGLPAAPSWTVQSDQADAWLGHSVSSAGDLDGDGFSDFALSAPRGGNGEDQEGFVQVYRGGPSTPVASVRIEGNTAYRRIGSAVHYADVNSDGYADLLIGATHGDASLGALIVHLGSSTGLQPTANQVINSAQAGSYFGYSVSGLGDVNGDGFEDVGVIASRHSGPEAHEGQATLFFGSAGPPQANASWQSDGVSTGVLYGQSVANIGDFNGDGFDDLAVGHPYLWNAAGTQNLGRVQVFFGGPTGPAATPGWTAPGPQNLAEFGQTVAAAGDVNGDGYDDLLVTARYHDDNQTNEGRAFLFLGGPQTSANQGITPAWWFDSDQAAATISDAQGIGDLNGDGYADLAVASNQLDIGFNPDAGRVWVFHGGPNGPSTTATWTRDGSAAYAALGSIGHQDVNADGFSDLVLGAPGWHNADATYAYLYLGGPSGLPNAPAWTAGGRTQQAFGYSVAGAGDIDGDGFGDVIVGAETGDVGADPNTNEGLLYVYHGSSSGLEAMPRRTINSGQPQARLGWPVATAGDLNGDGFADVLVAASSFNVGGVATGRVWAFPGSSTGVSDQALWTGSGTLPGSLYGQGLASGDFNGDGFSDIVVGAPRHDQHGNTPGRVWTYLGNGGGVAARPMARKTSGARLSIGAVIGGSSFNASLAGRSPVGRTRVKLELEAKPLRTPFDGIGLVRGTTWIENAGGAPLLQQALTNLPPENAYHYRARIVYDPAISPTTARSRWFYGAPLAERRGLHLRTTSPPCAAQPDGTACDDGSSVILQSQSNQYAEDWEKLSKVIGFASSAFGYVNGTISAIRWLTGANGMPTGPSLVEIKSVVVEALREHHTQVTLDLVNATMTTLFEIQNEIGSHAMHMSSPDQLITEQWAINYLTTRLAIIETQAENVMATMHSILGRRANSTEEEGYSMEKQAVALTPAFIALVPLYSAAMKMVGELLPSLAAGKAQNIKNLLASATETYFRLVGSYSIRFTWCSGGSCTPMVSPVGSDNSQMFKRQLYSYYHRLSDGRLNTVPAARFNMYQSNALVYHALRAMADVEWSHRQRSGGAKATFSEQEVWLVDQNTDPNLPGTNPQFMDVNDAVIGDVWAPGTIELLQRGRTPVSSQGEAPVWSNGYYKTDGDPAVVYMNSSASRACQVTWDQFVMLREPRVTLISEAAMSNLRGAFLAPGAICASSDLSPLVWRRGYYKTDADPTVIFLDILRSRACHVTWEQFQMLGLGGVTLLSDTHMRDLQDAFFVPGTICTNGDLGLPDEGLPPYPGPYDF